MTSGPLMSGKVDLVTNPVAEKVDVPVRVVGFNKEKRKEAWEQELRDEQHGGDPESLEQPPGLEGTTPLVACRQLTTTKVVEQDLDLLPVLEWVEQQQHPS
ncbi:UNVERIFIED_CONTAM: hypothetical protein FKN15_059448 [Acipenser sinensis]